MGENMSKLMRQATLAEDNDLLVRATAALAAARPAERNPRQWVQDRAYQLAVTEGWSEIAGAIPDGAIVNRVRQLLGIEGTAESETPPEVPDA